MKTILVLLALAILILILNTLSNSREGFSEMFILSPFAFTFTPLSDINIFGSNLILHDNESPYKPFSGGPQLSGQTYTEVASEHYPEYNNSDAAKERRGWTRPTEGSCIPNEICGKFYDKYLIK